MRSWHVWSLLLMSAIRAIASNTKRSSVRNPPWFCSSLAAFSLLCHEEFGHAWRSVPDISKGFKLPFSDRTSLRNLMSWPQSLHFFVNSENVTIFPAHYSSFARGIPSSSASAARFCFFSSISLCAASALRFSASSFICAAHLSAARLFSISW